MRNKLLFLMGMVLLIILSSCTSADEAPIVQQAIAQSMNADTDAVSTSVAIDSRGTAVAQEAILEAQKTMVAVPAQLTATAAPQVAEASASRRENKTASSNRATSAVAWTLAITIPVLGLITAVAYYRYTKRLGVVKIGPGELAIVGNRVVDGTTGAVRLLSQAQDQLPGRTAVQITHAAQPALMQGMGGEWIEDVVGAIQENEYEQVYSGPEEEDETPVDRRLGEHSG